MGRSPDPARARSAAIQVVRRLRDAGHVAYFAGGCVRDELLGLRPTDYDVATDARPDSIRALFDRTHLVGLAFGVLLVHVDECQIEVATFRADGPYSDTRRPDSIEFSDARSDAARRDFTINALFLDPLAPADPAAGAQPIAGHLIDFVGGLDDLRARRIRAVGDPDQRLAEDHLRALRAVRFAGRLTFQIETGTAAAIRRHAMQLRGVSRERIGEEVRRMMAHPSRAASIFLLHDLGLDAPVLNEQGASLDSSAGQPSPPTAASISATLPLLAGLEDVRSPFVRSRIRYGTALAAWCIDRLSPHVTPPSHLPDSPAPPAPPTPPTPWMLGKPAAIERSALVARLRRALCLSNDERDDLADALEGLGVLADAWPGLSVAGKKRVAARRWFKDALRLFLVRSPGPAAALEGQLRELAASPTGLTPEPMVTGDDLIALGFVPGPQFKSVLDRVFDAQLEGRVRSKDEAMELARELSV